MVVSSSSRLQVDFDWCRPTSFQVPVARVARPSAVPDVRALGEPTSASFKPVAEHPGSHLTPLLLLKNDICHSWHLDLHAEVFSTVRCSFINRVFCRFSFWRTRFSLRLSVVFVCFGPFGWSRRVSRSSLVLAFLLSSCQRCPGARPARGSASRASWHPYRQSIQPLQWI